MLISKVVQKVDEMLKDDYIESLMKMLCNIGP